MFASVNSRRTSKTDAELGSVQNPVRKERHTNETRQQYQYALDAEGNSNTTNTKNRHSAVTSVRRVLGWKRVLNLTLDHDNAYYANGILVDNCADALALTFALPEMPAQNDPIFERMQVDKPKVKYDYDPLAEH